MKSSKSVIWISITLLLTLLWSPMVTLSGVIPNVGGPSKINNLKMIVMKNTCMSRQCHREWRCWPLKLAMFYWSDCTRSEKWAVMHVCVRGINCASYYNFSIGAGHVLYMCVGGIDFGSISMIFKLLRKWFIICFFHLISITSTCITKDIGGQEFNAVAFCPKAIGDPFKLDNIKN
jgi:hypothetical protein